MVYDRLVGRAVLSLAAHALLIDGGKRRGAQDRIQDQNNQALVRHARLGHKTVRLKAGDPMVFGRGAEEWEYLLAHGVEVEVVPGISSAIAVPSLAGIPLTCRGAAAFFAVIAGHREQFMRIVLTGVENREYIAESLIRAGRKPWQPAAFIENGTADDERVVETALAAVANGRVEVQPPAVCVIGEVVRLRARLAPAQLMGARAS